MRARIQYPTIYFCLFTISSVSITSKHVKVEHRESRELLNVTKCFYDVTKHAYKIIQFGKDPT